MIRTETPNKLTVETRLEGEFSHRGLEFSTELTELSGHSTYGVIDGMRFEFTVRPDYSSLVIGVMDDEESMKQHEEIYAEWYRYSTDLKLEVSLGLHSDAEAKAKGIALEKIKPVLRLANGITDSPNRILMSSQAFLEKDDYREDEITEDAMAELFARHMNTLQVHGYLPRS